MNSITIASTDVSSCNNVTAALFHTTKVHACGYTLSRVLCRVFTPREWLDWF